MIFVAFFLLAVWSAGRISRLIGVSSIVLEVTTGLLLGPNTWGSDWDGLIPQDLSRCFTRQTTTCGHRDFQMKIANEDPPYKYCDLQAYLDNNKYENGCVPGQHCTHGWF